MQISANPQRRKLLIAPCFVLLGLYVFVLLRTHLAFRYGSRPDVASLQRAAQLDPGNAEYPYRIGQYYAVTKQDFPSALKAYKAAVVLNPRDARYWLELATVYLVSGNIAVSKQALDNAIRADPTTPDVVWQTANFDLVMGDTTRALHRFRTILERDPESLGRVLEICWRATHNPEMIVNDVLPARPDVYIRFLSVLAMTNDPYAPMLWSRLVALNQPLPVKESLRYVDYLIARRQISEAHEAWKEIVHLTPALRGYGSSRNLFVNSGFEEDVLNDGFDWRYDGRSGVTIAIDTGEPHTGARALAMSFAGSPTDAGLYQLIPVEPNTRYRFSIYVKAKEVVGVNGPRFALNDVSSGDAYVLTDPIMGTTQWTERTAEFTTSNDTRALIFRVLRSPAQMLVRGKILIDDLSLTTVN